jgi:hypothetical protein
MMRRVFQILASFIGSVWPAFKKSFISTKQSSVMKQKNIQQEILVPTQTSFARKTVIEGNNGHEKTSLVEELEKGFWNGLLNEMLPELMPTQDRRSELFIWQITVGETSILIDMAETPDIIEDSYSINHCCFLSLSKMN